MATLLISGSGAVLPPRRPPGAVIIADPEYGVLGSVVRLDGSQSTDPDDEGLSYAWEFAVVPIGSQVVTEGFRSLDDDGSAVSFSPDRSGEYVVKLTVTNPHFTSSTTKKVSIRAILVPDGRGFVPDGKFIWSYLRDAWQQVDSKEMFETLWSALLQIAGADLLRLYQIDFNKSIRDIQEKMQRRWLSYSPRLELDQSALSFYLGNEAAGTNASSVVLGLSGKAIAISATEVLVVQGSVLPDAPGPLKVEYSINPANLGTYAMLGANSPQTGYRLAAALPSYASDIILSSGAAAFTRGATTWAITGSLASVLPGDVAYVESGPSAGTYIISAIGVGTITVDLPAPAASTVGETVRIFRPIAFSVVGAQKDFTNSFAIPLASGLPALQPGRIITEGGKAHTILRITSDSRQLEAASVVTVEEFNVVPGKTLQNWRVPNTLISGTQSFEELGVRSGDLLLADLVDAESGLSVEVKAQVVGVVNDRLGFVLTTDNLIPGVVPPAPEAVFQAACEQLQVKTSRMLDDGSILNLGDAKDLRDYLSSLSFKTAYWNKQLESGSSFETPVGSFTLNPKAIIRNSLIPVDSTILSIPALQEWIKQPDLEERNGKLYQVKGQEAFELERSPVILIENNDYVLDAKIAYDDIAVFATGTDLLEVAGASFQDRRVVAGDTVHIPSPNVLAGDYVIKDVIDDEHVRLVRPLPETVSGLAATNLQVLRRAGGTFLRILPGGFSASNPMPDVLWAEVSYFDNSDAIERNFGILVGLTKSDLEKASPYLNYRQAVAGLMFAYTRGSSIERIRLGAQILLGLPYAEHRGVIRSIDPDYRLDASGNPLYGRILVEDLASDGTELGVQRIYTYPISDSSMAGLETSPVTGATYKVGDVVEQFAPLAKGLEVDDYITTPVPDGVDAKTSLQRYNSFQLRVDNQIFDTSEISLVSDFLRKITPSYVSFALVDVLEQHEDLPVVDLLRMTMRSPFGFVDNPTTGLQSALMADQGTFDGYRLVTLGGDLYEIRHRGTGSTAGGNTLTHNISSAALRANIATGDLLWLRSGPNLDETFTVNTMGASTITITGTGLQADAAVVFLVVRKVDAVRTYYNTGSGPTLVQNATTPPTTSMSNIIPATSQAVADFMLGDLIIFKEGTKYVRRTITEVTSPSAVKAYPAYTGTPAGEIRTVRPFLPLSSPDVSLVSNGTVWSSTDWQIMVLEPGDILAPNVEGNPELLVIDPETFTFFPVLSAGTYSYKVVKRRTLSYDFLDVGSPADTAFFRRTFSTNITSTSGSKNLNLGGNYAALDPRPGDLIKFSTLNQIENGYGTGVFPIASVSPGTTTVALTVAMTQSGSTGWSHLRRV